MPFYKVSITKSFDYRGRKEEVSNVYTFSNAMAAGAIDAGALILKVRDIERPVYGSEASFISGRCWLHVPGNKAASRMLENLNWNGIVGTLGTGQLIPHEATILYRWPLGRYGENNRNQFLQKWHHCLRANNVDTSTLRGASALGAAPAEWNTYGSSMRQFVTSQGTDGDFFLATDADRRPLTNGSWYNYVEHRQFRHGS